MTDEEYNRQKLFLDMEVESLVIPAVNPAKEAEKLIMNLRELWAAANFEEQQNMLLSMLDAVYVDTKLTRSVVALKPKPPFRPIFQVAVSRKGSKIRLIKDGDPDSSGPPSVFVVETGESRTRSETTPQYFEGLKKLFGQYALDFSDDIVILSPV
jgi:hypothetical protein